MVAHVEEVHTTGSELRPVGVFANFVSPELGRTKKSIRKPEQILLSRCRVRENLDANETNFFSVQIVVGSWFGSLPRISSAGGSRNFPGHKSPD